MRQRGFDTKAIHEGHGKFSPDSMSVPIYQSVAYPYADAREAAEIFRGEKPGYTYGRWDNPTVEAFEKRMAALEGAEAAIATASGMAAIFLLTHQLVQAGDEVVSSNRVYGGTFGLFDTGLPRMGAKVNWVTQPESIDAWKAAITPRTKFLFVESPSNPGLFIGDIRTLADLAHAHDLPLVVDNTICTPALQRPIEMGADVIVHSTTKYICGNASALGGIIVGSKKLIEDGIRQGPIRYLGPSMSPFNAWLNLTSLEHLSLRMERHCQNAMALATLAREAPAGRLGQLPGARVEPLSPPGRAPDEGLQFAPVLRDSRRLRRRRHGDRLARAVDPRHAPRHLQDDRHAPRVDDALRDGSRGNEEGRHPADDDPRVGRHRGRGRHHRGHRAGAGEDQEVAATAGERRRPTADLPRKDEGRPRWAPFSFPRRRRCDSGHGSLGVEPGQAQDVREDAGGGDDRPGAVPADDQRDRPVAFRQERRDVLAVAHGRHGIGQRHFRQADAAATVLRWRRRSAARRRPSRQRRSAPPVARRLTRSAP